MKKETILILCAHDDDAAVGMGGTLLKYAEEKKRIINIIFSYGQTSHPHLKSEVITKKRVSEAQKVNEKIGIKETIYFGLTDSKVKEEIQKYDIKEKLKKMINKYKPDKIFTPTGTDPHPDHRAVNNLIKEIVEEMKYKGEVLAFECWNVTNENLPTVYVDISDYMNKKIQLMRDYESQKLSIYAIMIPTIVRAKIYGRRNDCKYAERFYKIK